jgi:hypothetical protein
MEGVQGGYGYAALQARFSPNTELVMTIEEKFRILISDHEAQEATTPGRLADLVLTKVTASEQPSCLSSRAFYLLRRRGMDEFKLPRKAFSPNTSLDDIVPKHARKQSWDGLKKAVGAGVWPQLCRPRPLLYGLAIAVLVVFGVSGVLVGHSAGSWNLALVCALAVAVIASWLAALATRPLKLAFPPSIRVLETWSTSWSLGILDCFKSRKIPGQGNAFGSWFGKSSSSRPE